MRTAIALQVDAGGAVGVPLGDGTQITVSLPPGGGTVLVDAVPVDASAMESVAASLGGAAVPLAPPFTLVATFGVSRGGPGEFGGGAIPPLATVALPPLPQPDPAVGYAGWLQAISAADGRFLGFVPVVGAIDPVTGALLTPLSPPIGAGRSAGITLLPATISYWYVQNFDPGAHLFSGPTDDAVDFGPAAAQFTTFTVVAPPVNGRLFVYNPATDGYGWIDAAGVGPV